MLWKKPYKSYVALLTQSGVNNPTVIVLENTLGDSISWIRSDVGVYRGSLVSSFFNFEKTAIFMQSKYVSINTEVVFSTGNYRIFVSTFSDTVPTPSDDLLNNTVIEIRQYN